MLAKQLKMNQNSKMVGKEVKAKRRNNLGLGMIIAGKDA